MTKERSCPEDYATSSILTGNFGNGTGSYRSVDQVIKIGNRTEFGQSTKKEPRDETYTICFGNEESNCEDTNQTSLIDPRKKREAADSTVKRENSSRDTEINKCYLLAFESFQDKVQRLFELLTLLGSLAYILQALKELKRLGMDIFLQTWSAVPGRVMFMMSCILIVICFPMRLLCEPRIEDRLIAAAMFLTPMHFLFFCRYVGVQGCNLLSLILLILASK